MNPSLAIALTASFIALACGLLGAFLVLRKMTMVGDAISHAVLPGISGLLDRTKPSERIHVPRCGTRRRFSHGLDRSTSQTFKSAK